MKILDKFPIEGGQKDPKKRIIPFLPGGNLSILCPGVAEQPLWKFYLLLRSAQVELLRVAMLVGG